VVRAAKLADLLLELRDALCFRGRRPGAHAAVDLGLADPTA